MTEQPGPVPQRIGDAERDRAVEYLREHLAVGRITTEEFDERVDRVLRARYADDIRPAFDDLPAPRPDSPPVPVVTGSGAAGQVAPRPSAPPPVPVRVNRAVEVAAWVAWPITIMVLFATSWNYWWLIFIPIVISSYATHRRQELDGK